MTTESSYGIEFNGQRSDTLGLRVINPKEIGFPSKNKVVQSIPFSSNIVDLSDMFGGQSYGERTIKFTFLLVKNDKDDLYTQWTKTVNWLMGTRGKMKLKDDVMSEYYYLGEAQEAPTWDEYVHHGKFTVEFTCYPFRIHELPEGNDVWDTFNFELDVAQMTHYTINSKRKITLFNTGQMDVNPQIIATDSFTLITPDKKYEVPAGVTDSPEFILPIGPTQMDVIGNGDITFNWHKELI